MARTASILTSTEVQAVEYLASLSPNRAVVTNASGFVISSSATDAEVGYLSGVTSAIQTQLNGKGELTGTNSWSGSNTFTLPVLVDSVKGRTSAGVLIESNSGTDVALLGAGGGAGVTFYGGINGTSLSLSSTLTVNSTALVAGLTSVNSISIGNQATSASVGLELGNTAGGTPFIDFHNTAADFEARLILANATTLQLFFSAPGAFNVYADLYSGGVISAAYGYTSAGGYISNSVSDTTLANFTTAIPPHSYLIQSDYLLNGYTNGLYWYTGDADGTKPKAGIFTQNTTSGSYLYLGTSNSYTTGITSLVTIDYNGSLGIGGTPTNAFMVKSAPASGSANALIQNTSTSSSPSLEFKDAAVTPNRWWVGSGVLTGDDGTFFIYDRRQVAMRLAIDSAGKTSINGAGAGIGILDVNGSVSLNNNFTADIAALNPAYYTFASGATAYGMKLHWDGANFGTLLFAPDGAERFVGLGKTGVTGLTDGDFTIQMRLATSTANVGIWTTQSEIVAANSARLTVRQNNANSSGFANGWLAGSFGGNGGTGNVVIMGGASNNAIIGAHNYALSAWADLCINQGGGKVLIGDVMLPQAIFQVGSGTSISGAALSSNFIVEGPSVGGTASNESYIGSFALRTGGNVSSLAINAYRFATGADWTGVSMGISMNVDGTIRPALSGSNNSLWFNPNGNVSVGSTPFSGGGNFVVSGTTSAAPGTVYMTVANQGTGGSTIDFYSSGSTGYLGPSVGLSWSVNPFIFSISGLEVMRISANGCLGIFDTSADALLHLGGGTTSFAPLKLTSGTNLTTPQAGTFEFNNDSLYFTRTTSTRRQRINGSRFMIVRVLDSATDQTTGTTKGGDVVCPFAGTIINVYANVDTAGTTGTGTYDINKNGTTLMSTTKITIDSTEKDSRTAATPPVLTTTTVAVGDVLTFDIDAIQTTPAKGLSFTLEILEL